MSLLLTFDVEQIWNSLYVVTRRGLGELSYVINKKKEKKSLIVINPSFRTFIKACCKICRNFLEAIQLLANFLSWPKSEVGEKFP